MIFYLLIFGGLLSLYLIFKTRSFIFIIAALILLAFLRPDNVGSDYKSYVYLIESGFYEISSKNIFDFINGDLSENMSSTETGINAVREFGFSFLVIFLQTFTTDARVIINIIVCLIVFIYTYSFWLVCRKRLALCLILYYSIFLYFASYNTLRQSLAGACLFLAMALLYNRKKVMTALWATIACTIHSTAIIILPLTLLLYHIRISTKVIAVTLLILLTLDLTNAQSIFIKYLPSNNILTYDIDAGYTFEAALIYNKYVHYLGFVFHCILAYTFYWFYLRSNLKDRPLMNLWFGGLVLYILLIRSPNVCRLSEYLYAFQLLAIPRTMDFLSENNHVLQRKATIYISIYLICWQVFYLQSNWYGILPYF